MLTPTSGLTIAVVLLLLMVVLLLVWRVQVRRQLQERTPDSDRWRQAVGEARLEPGERPASLVSEQIEEMVARTLAQDESLANLSFDLGTEPDGSVAIWFDGVKYTDVESLPHARLRRALHKAIDSFNRPD